MIYLNHVVLSKYTYLPPSQRMYAIRPTPRASPPRHRSLRDGKTTSTGTEIALQHVPVTTRLLSLRGDGERGRVQMLGLRARTKDEETMGGGSGTREGGGGRLAARAAGSRRIDPARVEGSRDFPGGGTPTTTTSDRRYKFLGTLLQI